MAGRYELVRTLGAGGMGTVWLARDLLLDRDVAVKEVTGQSERVLREARAAARIVHPNVVTVYDVVAHEDRQWIVMQHVESRTLAEVITEDGPLPPERAAEIGLDLLAALRAAHDNGVLHRDVKPGNVLLDATGRAHLADFGIASADGEGTLTAVGTLIGAPSFMAPERVRGLTSGPASDFWSLGATIYAAVEGVVPFDRGDALATMTSVLMDEPPTPVHAGWLTPLLIGLLDKDPAQRPGHDEIFAAFSGSPLVQPTVPIQPTGPLVPVPVPVRRRKRAPIAVGAVATAAAVGVLLFLLRPSAPAQSEDPAVPPAAAATSSQEAAQVAPVRATTRSKTTTTAPTTTTTSTTTSTTVPATTEPTTTVTTTTAPAVTTTTAADQTSALPTT